jgi:hypothetical protein
MLETLGFDMVTVCPETPVTVAPLANPAPFAVAPIEIPDTESTTSEVAALTPPTADVAVVVVKVIWPATAAVFATLSVTVVPDTAVTTAFAAMPVPATVDPILIPVLEFTAIVDDLASPVAATEMAVVPTICPVTEPVLRGETTNALVRSPVTVAPPAKPEPLTCVPTWNPTVLVTLIALPPAIPATAEEVALGFWYLPEKPTW